MDLIQQTANFLPRNLGLDGFTVLSRLTKLPISRLAILGRAALLAARTERDNLRAEILRQMRDLPILLSPVSTEPAFRHGEGNYQLGAPHCYRDTMRFSQWLNLTGFPGATVPLGMSPEGLPIGVQIVGRPYGEALIISLAAQIERAAPWGAHYPATMRG